MGSINSKGLLLSSNSISKKNKKAFGETLNVGQKGYFAATLAMDSRSTKEPSKKRKKIIGNTQNADDKGYGTIKRFTKKTVSGKDNSRVLKALFKKLNLPESMLYDPKYEAQIEQFKRKNSKTLKKMEAKTPPSPEITAVKCKMSTYEWYSKLDGKKQEKLAQQIQLSDNFYQTLCPPKKSPAFQQERKAEIQKTPPLSPPTSFFKPPPPAPLPLPETGFCETHFVIANKAMSFNQQIEKRKENSNKTPNSSPVISGRNATLAANRNGVKLTPVSERPRIIDVPPTIEEKVKLSLDKSGALAGKYTNRKTRATFFMITVFEFWFQIPSKTCTMPIVWARIASYFTCVYCTAAGTTDVYELSFSYLSISIFTCRTSSSHTSHEFHRPNSGKKR